MWCGVDVVTPHSIYGTPLTAPPPPSVKRHIDRTLIVLRLGHAMYWRDLRAVNRRMTEPYFGGDLEMELGDSFVASVFGGWTPVPVATDDEFRASCTFEQGIAWRQHLTWDHHRTRPRYRAHYSIPVR